jgi:hypothetical protein
MSIEIQYFGITGIIGPSNNKDLPLLTGPSTGVDGRYDVALDSVDGPAQTYGIDFGVTSYGYTAAVVLNIAGSDIVNVQNNYSHGVTGVLNLRVVYNY